MHYKYMQYKYINICRYQSHSNPIHHYASLNIKDPLHQGPPSHLVMGNLYIVYIYDRQSPPLLLLSPQLRFFHAAEAPTL